MTTRARIALGTTALALLAAAFGCGPTPSYVEGGTAEVAVGAAPGVQYLYVPGTSIPVESIQAVLVRTSDGRELTLDASQVRAVAGGRLSIAVPAGVTTGTATIVTTSGTVEIPFHIAAAMSGPVVGTVSVPTGSPDCAAIAGTWVGTINNAPGAVATFYLEILGDCRTVRGFLGWRGPTIGSVDATIDGYWDAGSRMLVARDTQLYNVRPRPGGGFCPTERYELTLSPDGMTLTGLNIIETQPACRGRSPVHLTRGR